MIPAWSSEPIWCFGYEPEVRLRTLMVEALMSARARKVSTVMTAVLVGAMCVTTALTVGRTAAAEQQVAARLSDAGSRHLQLTDVKSLGFLSDSVVDAVNGFDTVERAIGVSTPVDVTNQAVGVGGTRVPAWTLHGDMADAITLIAGRLPEPGEALVAHGAMDALGLDFPLGAVTVGRDSISSPIVGSFDSRAPYAAFDAGVVIAAAPGAATHTLDVVIRSSSAAAVTESAVLSLLSRGDTTDLSIESPRTLAEVQSSVLGDLGQANRSLLVLVLAGGAGLVAVVALSDVLLQRTDLGRRRALGAPRWVLTTLVVAKTVFAALGGAVVGSVIGVVVNVQAGQVPMVSFVAGTAVLSVLTAAVAVFPPAFLAAFQDPVRVLRTP
jgi:putative ABC transport system permease protein